MTAADNRRAPVQGERGWDTRLYPDAKPPGSIDWDEHLAIYEIYAAKFGRSQTAECLADRGGFGYLEIVYLTGEPPKTWVRS